MDQGAEGLMIKLLDAVELPNGTKLADTSTNDDAEQAAASDSSENSDSDEGVGAISVVTDTEAPSLRWVKGAGANYTSQRSHWW